MSLVAVFLVIFVVGPALFRALTRNKATKRTIRMLLICAIAGIAAGLGLRFVAGDQWGIDLWFTLGPLVLFWLAWICLIALGVHVVKYLVPGRRTLWWTEAGGLIGVVIPWFGLALAWPSTG